MDHRLDPAPQAIPAADSERRHHAVAIVGLGAVLPDAPNAPAFWRNVCERRTSIREVPADRWREGDYFDSDPKAPDKTYSKIGAWVRGFEFDWKRFKVPPKVAATMDASQQWAIVAAAEALADYGFPARALDTDRTGVILGTAMGGQNHLESHLRISYPEYLRLLESTPSFAALGATEREQIKQQWHEQLDRSFPPITEDTMPGELANVVSGRVANVLNLRGPNFITDAACASSLAAVSAAVKMLLDGHCDAVLTGGVDHNMSASTFVKFSKVGALSARGSFPFGVGADGFVMGEGCAVLLLRRLADAERDGDRIYAVIRGIGVSSDGKGKGITAPNPVGQALAIRRAWQDAGCEPATVSLLEGHGTSTVVGDRVELETLGEVFTAAGRRRIALGSVKSNIGHLKAAAGAASLLKVSYALRDKLLPPTVNAEPPNAAIDFDAAPYYLNHTPAPWPNGSGTPRRAGISSYGFGGTNFHLVLEEHVPGSISAPGPSDARPPRRILAVGAEDGRALGRKLGELRARLGDGWRPPAPGPDRAELASRERVVLDFATDEELASKLGKAHKAAERDAVELWKALEPQGIFRGTGEPRGKVAFLFPGQGSQYLNMGRELGRLDPSAGRVFDEADAVMTPILGRPLSSFVLVGELGGEAARQAELALTDTAITQPAVISMDIALHRLLGAHGFVPDLVMGHSLGEYAALVAAGVMPFAQALEATAARGREMSSVEVADKGLMAAVFAPFAVIERTVRAVDGYVVMANINSHSQCVIGGESRAVEQALARLTAEGHQALLLPVSHAFHTRIVAAASKPLRQVLDRLDIRAPRIPVVSNVSAELYPADESAIKDLLEQQVATPVQWRDGLRTLYAAGARTFVEVGPKKALKGFVDDVFQGDPNVVSLFTNHPKTGELQSFNHALCGLYAAGHGSALALAGVRTGEQAPELALPDERPSGAAPQRPQNDSRHDTETDMTMNQLSALLSQAFSEMGRLGATTVPSPGARPYDQRAVPAGSVVITGTGIGLPGAEKPVMAPDNMARLLRGEQLIDLVPERFRRSILRKRVTRLVKDADGSGHFEPIGDESEVIKLAGRPGSFDLAEEYGVPTELVEALDITSQLAMAAGLDALRDAGIPLVQTYRATRSGKQLPDRWLLPESMRDETGVVFASAFPALDSFADELRRYHTHEGRRAQLEALESVARLTTDRAAIDELTRRCEELRHLMATEGYGFDRRFLFRVLTMGHSQFAQYIGARGPNTAVNTACASAGMALTVAEDWIRTGRCRRVIVIAGDAVTSNNLLEWMGAGFQAAGAAATDDRVAEAAVPFDRRRHGMVLGMGASALCVESEDAVRERGMRGMAELLASDVGNSAYHGTRLDPEHVAGVMDRAVGTAERRFGLSRQAMASSTLFLSHETYTPARGGSASAEVAALRRTFGQSAQEVLVVNTKGLTGHPMGVGIEAAAAVNMLEQALVPAIPNYREPDPDLGPLKLSRGGRYPAQYALVFSAGFGSQVAVSLLRRIGGALSRVENEHQQRSWLADVSGYASAELEVHKRVLRIKAQGSPTRVPSPSRWTPGVGPELRVGGTLGPELGQGSNAPEAWVDAPVPSWRQPSTLPPWSAGPTSSAPPTRSAPPPSPAPSSLAPPSPAPSSLAPPSPAPSLALPPPSPVPSIVLPAPSAAPAAGSSEPAGGATPEPLRPVSRPSGAAAPDPIAAEVIRIIARKTGYPEDMLEPDLDLEADLGIDTVKQAETLAEIRRAFDIPPQENLRLRDYPTLARVVQFVKTSRPELAAPEPTASESVGDSGEPPRDEEPRSAEAGDAPIAAPSGDEAIMAAVLRIVAAKTGYPEDMLELDLDLEADLGIDTVKQAETFAEVRATFGIPRIAELRLRDYPTLRAVAEFVKHGLAAAARSEPSRPASPPLPSRSAAPAAPSEPAATGCAAPSEPTANRYRLEDAGRVPRRVPVVTALPPLGICRPTSVALGSDARVVVALDQGGVGAELVERLSGRGVTPLVLEPRAETEALCAQLEQWLREGPVSGIYWLRALDAEPELDTLEPGARAAAIERGVKALSCAMRTLYGTINAPDRFLVCGTRLGGLHGYGAAGALAPLGGGVTGLAKAYRREQPAALVKALDFAADCPAALGASRLLDETLYDPTVVEVGYEHEQRSTISLEERAVGEGPALLELGPGTVFVVTGAAGGITSAIVEDLAQASGGTFHLLDLASEPRRDDPDIALFRHDREALKRELCERAKLSGEKITPQAIERQLAAVERSAAALAAIEAIERAGGRAHYYALDLTDHRAVAETMSAVRQRHQRIDVLIHAAGIEVSRRLDQKSRAQFDLVHDVKVQGMLNLLAASRDLPIGCCLVFSSVAGRFGNVGQTDYSAANDTLCKIASALGRRGTRGVAIDWTAWASIGMASRGSLPAIMAQAGIELLAPEVGVPTVRRELLYNPGGEVVVASALGTLLADPPHDGGIDPERAQAYLDARRDRWPLIAELRPTTEPGAIEARTTLDPRTEPFLFDHQVEPGVAFLPGVMGIEAFVELASLLCGPMAVGSLEQVAFHSPFKFYGNEPRTLLLGARAVREPCGDWLVRVELASALKRSFDTRASLPEQRRAHFTATVRMKPTAEPEAPRIDFALPSNGHLPLGRDEIYGVYFHGPAYRVLERAYVDHAEAVGVMAAELPADASRPNAGWLAAPRLLELGLQTAGLWSLACTGSMGLPRSIGSVRLYPAPSAAEAGPLYALCRPVRGGEAFDLQLLDARGRLLAEMADYRTIAIDGPRPAWAGTQAAAAQPRAAS